MDIGKIKIKSLKVGDMDLTGKENVHVAGFNVYEDILNPYGPVAEIRIIDPMDSLGQKNITGSFDQDVEIHFSPEDGTNLSGDSILKLKMFKNVNLNDQSLHNTGSGKHKQYDLRCVSPELLNAQGNQIEKSFDAKTSDIVEHVLKEGFKTKRKMDITATKGKRRIVVPRSHPIDVISMLNHEHVSEKYESSVFALFQQAGSEHKYVFKTFEELFDQEPVVTLTQSVSLNHTTDIKSKQNSIRWFRPSTSFDSSTRALDKTSQNAIDMTSYKITEADKKEKTKFVFADKNSYYDNPPTYVDRKPIPIRHIDDRANNKQKHETSSAKTKRAAYLSHLAQNSAELEVYYNPKIVLGSTIYLNIPKKSNSEEEAGEGQINGKFLVVAVRTKYRTAAEPPHCTMILRVVKASVKKGKGGSA